VTIKRAKLLVLAFFVLLAAGAFVGMRLGPANGVQQRLAAIREAGLPASAAELDAWYKAVPEERNRALLLAEAAAELAPVPDLKAGEAVTPEILAKVAASLEANREVLRKVHRAAQLPDSRYPIDLTRGFAVPLPHLAAVKQLVQLLRAEALHQAHRGDAAGSVRAIQSGLAVSGSLRAEPLLISELVAVAGDTIVAGALEGVLAEITLSGADLSSLARSFAAAEERGRRSLQKALTGERAVGISTFRANLQALLVLTSGPGPAGAGNGGLQDWFRHVAFQAYRASGLRERDLECYLEMMGLFVQAAQHGFPEALERSAEAERIMNQRFSTGFGRLAVMSRMVLPSVLSAAKKEAVCAARVRCALTALAIERFRLEKDGALPEVLDQIAPAYLHAVPADPFTGGPLFYERLPGKGYRVSSPGAPTERRRNQTNVEPAGFTVKR